MMKARALKCLIVEASIDICRHISTAKGWTTAGTPRDYLQQCAEHEVMPTDLAGELTRCVGLRNIIIHGYLTIEYEKLYEKTLKLMKHMKEFERCVSGCVIKEFYGD
jgi:uncharacterized protein YutE (UPF0331/DUF86 family)